MIWIIRRNTLPGKVVALRGSHSKRRVCLLSVVALALIGLAADASAQGRPNWPDLVQAELDQADRASAEAMLSGEDGEQLLIITPWAGYGAYKETTVEYTSDMAHGGVGTRWYPDARTRAQFLFSVGGRERRFVPTGVGTPGSRLEFFDDERVWDFTLDYGFNLLADTNPNLWFIAGWRHIFYESSDFDQHATGALAGLQLEVPIVNFLAFQAGVDHIYNVVSTIDEADQPGDSLVGSAQQSLRYEGGFRYYPAADFEIGLAYQGEYVTFEFSDLLTHQVVLEAGIALRFD